MKPLDLHGTWMLSWGGVVTAAMERLNSAANRGAGGAVIGQAMGAWIQRRGGINRQGVPSRSGGGVASGPRDGMQR